jgi:KDO2-lipid IV(A) lauroyltransferase
MRMHWVFLRFVLDTMFLAILPIAGRLPLRVGRRIAVAVGQLCYLLDLDWRTVALRSHFVRYRTGLAIKEMAPNLSDQGVMSIVRGRFLSSVVEELEGHWFARQRAHACSCEFEGIEAIQTAMADGRGLMLLTLHFDAALMGVVQMGLAGCKLNLMTSDVVEDRRVVPSVQRYFRHKYAGIEGYLNGGRAMHVEHHLKSFYSALRRGEGVVILGEAPTTRAEDALKVDFLGKRRAIAPGAVRMAEKTGSPMAAFVCLHLSGGGYKVIFSPVFYPSAQDGHAASASTLFDYLGEHVRRNPERWWAADQLPNFINLDSL